jgi:dTMP kinase
MIMRGLFITFEGCEGSGKSTQSTLLSRYLEEKGYNVIHTREPGGTELGERIRQILLNSSIKDFKPKTELFLFCAARHQLVEEVIKPALKEGFVVISDRFCDATLAYQGFGRGIDLEIIKTLNKITVGDIKPDITFFLDLNVEDGLKKARESAGSKEGSGPDRIEEEDISFHKLVRQGYIELSKINPAIKRINGSGTIKEIQNKIRDEVDRLLQKKGIKVRTGC